MRMVFIDFPRLLAQIRPKKLAVTASIETRDEQHHLRIQRVNSLRIYVI